MGWIGFGVGMGFRTMRYTRRAVRSTMRNSGSRNYRSCPRRQPARQPYQLHRPKAGLAAVLSTFAVGLFIGADILLNQHGCRYYTVNGVLYWVNDNAAAEQWCVAGAFASFFAIWIFAAMAGSPASQSENVKVIQGWLRDRSSMPSLDAPISQVPPVPPADVRVSTSRSAASGVALTGLACLGWTQGLVHSVQGSPVRPSNMEMAVTAGAGALVLIGVGWAVWSADDPPVIRRTIITVTLIASAIGIIPPSGWREAFALFVVLAAAAIVVNGVLYLAAEHDQANSNVPSTQSVPAVQALLPPPKPQDKPWRGYDGANENWWNIY